MRGLEPSIVDLVTERATHPSETDLTEFRFNEISKLRFWEYTARLVLTLFWRAWQEKSDVSGTPVVQLT